MTLINAVGDNSLTGALPSGANNGTPLMLANGSGTFAFGVHVTAVSGTSPTLNVKVQDSDDGVTFGDVTGATLTQLTAAGNTSGFGHSTKKFVRLVGTVGGSATPTVTCTAGFVGFGAV